ncbi:MAG: hypothetical protein H0V73_09740 [Chloroflexi bacterium]|nr:hypothetical protein [Chloroflexota bacterium]
MFRAIAAYGPGAPDCGGQRSQLGMGWFPDVGVLIAEHHHGTGDVPSVGWPAD